MGDGMSYGMSYGMAHGCFGYVRSILSPASIAGWHINGDEGILTFNTEH